MNHQHCLSLVMRLTSILLLASLLLHQVMPTKAELHQIHLSTALAQPAKSGIANIIANKKIRVGVRADFGPYGFSNEEGCCIGFDIDIAREFALRWLGDSEAVDLIPVKPDERIERLINDEVDLVIGAMTHSRTRDEHIDFSQSYFRDGLRLLVHQESEIRRIDDLKGRRVGGVIGTVGLNWLNSVTAQYNFAEVVTYTSYDEAVSVLSNNGIDGFVSDGGGLVFRTQENPNLVVVDGPYTTEYYGVGVRQGDSPLRELVDFTLQAMKEDGTYDDIYRRWFPSEDPFPVQIMPGQKLLDINDYRTELPKSNLTDLNSPRENLMLNIGISEETGFDADIAREFVLRWLGSDEEPILRVVETGEGLEQLEQGEINLLIASTVPTLERTQQYNVDFSQVYATEELALLVRNESGIDSLEDLDGKRIAVLEDGGGTEWLTSQQTLYAIEGQRFSSDSEAVALLQSGEIDVVVGDEERLSSWVTQDDELSLLEQQSTVPYAIGVANGDYRLRELVNFTLQEMKADGYYDCLHQKWYPNRVSYPIEILSGEENYLGINYQRLDDESCLPVPTIQKIRDRGNVLWAGVPTNFPPMGFTDENGNLVGFDIDLVKAIADLWGVEVEFVQVLSNERIPILVAGDVDLVAAGMTHTRDRDAFIDFSKNYFLDGQRLLVQRNSGITDPIDLQGKRVGVITGTTSIQEIQAFADNKGIKIEVVPFIEHTDALQALKNGSVDAFTSDGIALQWFAKDLPSLIVVGDPFTSEPYGIGLRAGDSAFRHLVDSTLEQLKRNGIYDQIYQRWVLDSNPYPIEIIPGEWSGSINDIQGIFDPDRSILQKMQREKRIVVGIMEDFPPFGTLDAAGACCDGFDADIVREFTKRWLGDDSNKTLKFIPLIPDERIPAIVQDEVDFVAGAMTRTWDREKEIDFSQTYFLDGQSLLVQEDSGITGLDDLRGKRIGAVQGTTPLLTLETYVAESGFEIVSFLEHRDAIEALKNGNIEAFSTDKMALLSYAKENPELIVVGDTFTFEPYGIGIPENDHQLRDLINSTLQEMWLDGTYRRLHDKWLSEVDVSNIEIWPRKVYAGHIGFSQAPMVFIPAGEFTRGDEEGESDARPAKKITIDAFYIDQYEVTNRLYRECVSAQVCIPPQRLYSLEERGDYYNNVDRYGNYPVIWVTWEQAETYCKYLGKRLPTEAEWEKAARGPEESSYPWGDELLREVRDMFENRRDTVLIRSTPLDVSGYNVYDMAGNVREWVSDYYDRNYYEENITQNPRGPRTAVRKGVRGGSWGSSQPKLWRNANREGYQATNYANNVGFRCASDQPPIALLPTQP